MYFVFQIHDCVYICTSRKYSMDSDDALSFIMLKQNRFVENKRKLRKEFPLNDVMWTVIAMFFLFFISNQTFILNFSNFILKKSYVLACCIKIMLICVNIMEMI